MKTKLILSLLFLCVAVFCDAQENLSKYETKNSTMFGDVLAGKSTPTKRNSTLFCNFAIAVRGGLSVSNMFNEHYDKSEWRRGCNFGLTFDFIGGERLSGRTGFIYNEKGTNGTDGYYIHLNYLGMPLLAVFRLPIEKNVKLEVQAGPFFSYGISGEYKVMLFGDSYSATAGGYNNYDYTPCFKDSKWGDAPFQRFDAGVNVGLGVDVYHFYFGISYELSLGSDDDWRKHCYMFDLGYTFDFWKK